MDKPKGGRGHRLPYRTVSIRIPQPLEKAVTTLANHYRMSQTLPNEGELMEALGIAKHQLQQIRDLTEDYQQQLPKKSGQSQLKEFLIELKQILE